MLKRISGAVKKVASKSKELAKRVRKEHVTSAAVGAGLTGTGYVIGRHRGRKKGLVQGYAVGAYNQKKGRHTWKKKGKKVTLKINKKGRRR